MNSNTILPYVVTKEIQFMMRIGTSCWQQMAQADIVNSPISEGKKSRERKLLNFPADEGL